MADSRPGTTATGERAKKKEEDPKRGITPQEKKASEDALKKLSDSRFSGSKKEVDCAEIIFAIICKGGRNERIDAYV